MKLTARELTHISLLAALTYISGFIIIPMGPVPFTLQTLFVLLTGLLLRPSAALWTQVVHLVLKLLLGGGQMILIPSFGFLLGFILAAWGMSLYLQRMKKGVSSYMIAAFLGTVLIYLIGMPYMALIVNGYMKASYSIVQIFWMGMGLFIPGDLVKAGLAVFVGKRLKHHLRLAN